MRQILQEVDNNKDRHGRPTPKLNQLTLDHVCHLSGQLICRPLVVFKPRLLFLLLLTQHTPPLSDLATYTHNTRIYLSYHTALSLPPFVGRALQPVVCFVYARLLSHGYSRYPVATAAAREAMCPNLN